MQWNREIDRCKRLGLPDPEPLPHPDDVIIDYRQGTFRIAGLITKEKATRDRCSSAAMTRNATSSN